MGYLVPEDLTRYYKREEKTPVHHPGGAHKGYPMGRHMEDSDFGSGRDHGGSRRPPNSN